MTTSQSNVIPAIIRGKLFEMVMGGTPKAAVRKWARDTVAGLTVTISEEGDALARLDMGLLPNVIKYIDNLRPSRDPVQERVRKQRYTGPVAVRSWPGRDLLVPEGTGRPVV
jgi:hypothetical protein